MIKQEPTALDIEADAYMRRHFGFPWSWSVALQRLEANPLDVELLTNLRQMAHSEFAPTTTLNSFDLKLTLQAWEGMNNAERARSVAGLLDQA